VSDWEREYERQVRAEAVIEGCTCRPDVELVRLTPTDFVARIFHDDDCPLCDAGLSPTVGLPRRPPDDLND